MVEDEELKLPNLFKSFDSERDAKVVAACLSTKKNPFEVKINEVGKIEVTDKERIFQILPRPTNEEIKKFITKTNSELQPRTGNWYSVDLIAKIRKLFPTDDKVIIYSPSCQFPALIYSDNMAIILAPRVDELKEEIEESEEF